MAVPAVPLAVLLVVPLVVSVDLAKAGRIRTALEPSDRTVTSQTVVGETRQMGPGLSGLRLRRYCT